MLNCSFFGTHIEHLSKLASSRPRGLVVQRLTRILDLYRHEKIIGSIPIVGRAERVWKVDSFYFCCVLDSNVRLS